jgi:hypothetical protein
MTLASTERDPICWASNFVVNTRTAVCSEERRHACDYSEALRILKKFFRGHPPMRPKISGRVHCSSTRACARVLGYYSETDKS